MKENFAGILKTENPRIAKFILSLVQFIVFYQYIKIGRLSFRGYCFINAIVYLRHKTFQSKS